jgi:hypothetical protein
MYIVRFSLGNEIKTIKLCNKESCDYLVNDLEEKNIQYVVIKNISKLNTYIKYINSLLDYKVED